ncbi:MAG: efflux RND transporter periplasmic adaptor subunit [Bacteroidia bacterium]|uniref:efflux RND transporter periplasmic adaptor subunit n=1 Tax=Candidatus Pollutiaquabacter sp. TaxID=3416354 RepID=UPI001A4155D5|nr:efflux RND transporter periplasmic adaptor subunit [Bacteroidota bacterium]MBL7947742.1 efflux RND transporter periplasmic adaptor subunit [Bacteroidia bacterium]
MKKSSLHSTVILTTLTIVLYACGSGSDKHAELEKLKKEQATLKEKITALEAEIAQSDTSKNDEKSKLVAIKEMKPETFKHYIEIQAKVDGDEDVIVSPESMGNITSLQVQAGDRVVKGQLLATIDDRMIRQGVAEAQTQLDLATQVFNRQKNLWDQKIGSEIQFLQAKTNKEALEKRVASLQEQLEMTRIKSPINGTVDQVDIKIGQAVAPGMPAFRVVNLNALKVTGEVAESFISKVNRGNETIISIPDMGKEINTKLDYAGRAINTLNRTFNVEVRLSPKDGELHPNMVAVMKIVDYTASSTFVVPIAAIQKSSDGEYVFVAVQEGGRLIAKRKKVSAGMIYNGMIEVREGLAEGDQVVTAGFQSIIEGDPIRL